MHRLHRKIGNPSPFCIITSYFPPLPISISTNPSPIIYKINSPPFRMFLPSSYITIFRKGCQIIEILTDDNSIRNFPHWIIASPSILGRGLETNVIISSLSPYYRLTVTASPSPAKSAVFIATDHPCCCNKNKGILPSVRSENKPGIFPWKG